MHALNYIPKRRWERDGDSPLYLPRYEYPSHRRRTPAPFNPGLTISTPTALTPGTASGTNVVTIANITLAAGDTLFASANWNATNTVTSFVWNSIALQLDAGPNTIAGAAKHVLYSLYVTSGATASLVLTLSGNATILVEPLKSSGLLSSSYTDQQSLNVTASTTSPSTAATSTLSQANELVIGCLARTGSTIGGTWQNSFTEIHTSNNGANGVNDTSYLIVSSTAAVTLQKTGVTNAPYSVICQTYKGASSVISPEPVTVFKQTMFRGSYF